MSRTAKQRVDALRGAIESGSAFLARVQAAECDLVKCADLMAEAIQIGRDARGIETVRKDGRVVFCMEELQACYCMDAARAAYLRARENCALTSSEESLAAEAR